MKSNGANYFTYFIKVIDGVGIVMSRVSDFKNRSNLFFLLILILMSKGREPSGLARFTCNG